MRPESSSRWEPLRRVRGWESGEPRTTDGSPFPSSSTGPRVSSLTASRTSQRRIARCRMHDHRRARHCIDGRDVMRRSLERGRTWKGTKWRCVDRGRRRPRYDSPGRAYRHVQRRARSHCEARSGGRRQGRPARRHGEIPVTARKSDPGSIRPRTRARDREQRPLRSPRCRIRSRSPQAR